MNLLLLIFQGTLESYLFLLCGTLPSCRRLLSFSLSLFLEILTVLLSLFLSQFLTIFYLRINAGCFSLNFPDQILLLSQLQLLFLDPVTYSLLVEDTLIFDPGSVNLSDLLLLLLDSGYQDCHLSRDFISDRIHSDLLRVILLVG